MILKNEVFLLQKSITKNIGETPLGNFIKKSRLNKEFTERGKEKESFISDMINENKIKREDLNEFLYKELLYGRQKENYIRKFSESNINLDEEEAIINAVSKAYPGINGNVNYISTNFFTPGGAIEALPLFRILKDKSTGKVKKIHFIYSEKVGRYLFKGKAPTYEHSFIPIEVDIEKKIIITRIARKDKMSDDNQKYELLQNKYSDKVIDILGLSTEIFVDHKETLYLIMTHLVNQIFKKMCDSKPKDIDPIIKKSCKDLLEKLKIDDFENKKASKNIFDLEANINRLIDHMLISNILFSIDLEEKLEGVDGIITYLKFKDGGYLQAILTGENYDKAIYDSDAFMGLRNTIDNVKEVLEVNIIWYDGKRPIRVKYNMASPQFVSIYFYKYYNQGDFEYALGKFEEFRSGNTCKDEKLDKACTN